MQKRGQATTFIIIGLVLIIIISLIFGVRNFVLKSDFERQQERHANIPIEIQPISQEIDSCLQEKTAEAITRVGLQGGYSTLPTEALPTTSYTPLGAAIQLIPGSDIATAVWQREKPNGIYTSQVPTKKQIENEIEKEIEATFSECADGVDKYIDQGFSITTIGTPQVQTQITDESVTTVVNFPIQLAKDNINFPLNTHLAQVETKFGQMIEMAQEISAYQQTEMFLEQKTIDMMIAYDDIVPFSGTNFDCGKRTWQKEDITYQLKQNLYYNTQALRAKNTQNQEANEFLQLDPFSKNHQDINVNFAYSTSWPTVIDIQQEQDTLEEQNIGDETATLTGNILTQFFCMNNHHFVYDIKYPILITLTDDNGYIFQYATQVIIDNNEPRQDTTARIEIVQEENVICQYATEDISVETYTITEQDTPQRLPHTQVSLKCGQATCPLGKTNSNGELHAKAPQCANGILQAKHAGHYIGKTIIPGTMSGSNIVTLEPYYEKNIIIKVIDKERGTRQQYDSELTTITFEHVQTPFTTTTTGELPIDLVQGKYKITTTTIGESTWPITVPKTVTQTCTDTKGKGIASFFAQPEQCFSIETESYELEQVLKGGVSYEFTFTRDMLTSNRPITMYSFAEPVTTDTEQIAQRQFAMATNAQDPRFREPHL